MPSTYSTNLKIELIALGEQVGTWGTTTNTNLGTALEQAIVGRANVSFTTDANKTTDIIQRIYCQMETGLLGDSMDLKQLAYGELDCSEISGTVDVKVSFRGTKGTYQNILSTRLLADRFLGFGHYDYIHINHRDFVCLIQYVASHNRYLI